MLIHGVAALIKCTHECPMVAALECYYTKQCFLLIAVYLNCNRMSRLNEMVQIYKVFKDPLFITH